MSVRHPLTVLPITLLMLTLGVACERSTETSGAPTEAAESVPIAGMYEVTGTTIEIATGKTRDISGTVILKEDGANYTATFNLNTVFDSEEGVLPAEVIGKGSGTIEGRTLRGTAETQLVISSVPGIDPAFAFIPRTTTTRLVSSSLTSIAADGTLEITIENTRAAGEAYRSTRTTLRGARTKAPNVASGGGLPSVAAAPPEDDE